MIEIQEALKRLYSLHDFGVKLGLSNITRLVEHLGNPQNKFKIIHVAGSNGKGSVASFLASILTESGKKTGLYTSPHFVRFNERIKIDGEEIGDERIARFIEETDDFVKKHKPTFFEVTTALAFQYFAEEKIDIAIVETGLGGRLDATNVVNPLASVITTISYEHTNILGKTLPEIAAEKGGIIKRDTPLFVGLLPDEAMQTIENIARDKSSPVFKLNDYLTLKKDYAVLKTDDFEFKIYGTGLRGKHQLTNSALAVLTALKSEGIRDYRVLDRGLRNVVKNTGIQGRYEIYLSNPKIIFDSAHNEAGIKVFLEEFSKEETTCEKKTLIFGAMKDKNIAQMLKMLSFHFDKIYVTTIDYERAASIETISEIADKLGIKTSSLPEPLDFIEEFAIKVSNECLVVLGSIYILGYLKQKLLESA